MEALKGFLMRVKEDHRVGPLHVSLYVVLLEISDGGESPGVFAIYRNEVMAKAKIRAASTYYKVMKELSEWGYVVYIPERWPGKRSKVGVVR